MDSTIIAIIANFLWKYSDSLLEDVVLKIEIIAKTENKNANIESGIMWLFSNTATKTVPTNKVENSTLAKSLRLSIS